MATARKSSKKRPATSQAGPTPKKVHQGKSGRTEKKRGRPVTLPAKDFATGSDSEGDSDDRGVGTGQDDEWIGEADDVEGEGLVGNEIPPDCAPFGAPPPKDPNGESFSLILRNDLYHVFPTVQLLVKPIKFNEFCTSNAALPNRIRHYSLMQNECGPWHGRKIYPLLNVRNMSTS